MNKRIVLLFACLAVSYVSVVLIGSGKDASAVTDVDLTSIPTEIDGWVGSEVEISDDTVKVLNTHSFINRIYREPTGTAISLHIANWTNPVTITSAPHHPETCYAGAGWSVIARRTTGFSTVKGKVPIELILFRKGQQYVVTGHWFRTGDVTYIDSKGFQSQRRRFWGSKSWPNTTKFLIQVGAPSLDAAEASIVKFATKIENRIASVGQEPTK